MNEERQTLVLASADANGLLSTSSLGIPIAPSFSCFFALAGVVLTRVTIGKPLGFLSKVRHQRCLERPTTS